MAQTQDATIQDLTKQLWWEIAFRDNMRVARRLHRKQVIDGVYRLDGYLLSRPAGRRREGLVGARPRAAIPRARLPFIQICLALQTKDPVGD